MAKKKPTKKTLVGFVLDSSGSMSSMKEAAIGLFNQQVEEFRKAKGVGRKSASLVVFGEAGGPPVAIPGAPGAGPWAHGLHFTSGVRTVHENVNPKDIPLLTDATYRPQANTPMRDGIGRMINILEAADDGGEDTAVLVVVVTDGYENASQEWTAAALSAKVAELQGTGRWTFSLFGAEGLDLAELRDTAGLGTVFAGNVGTFVPTSAGLDAGSVRMASASSVYYTSRTQGVTATSTFLAADEDETPSGVKSG